MSTHGKLLQHGKPQRRGAKPRPDAREGQAGPPGVADGFVVPRKPGNAGGGKGPEFKEGVRRGMRARRVARAYHLREWFRSPRRRPAPGHESDVVGRASLSESRMP